MSTVLTSEIPLRRVPPARRPAIPADDPLYRPPAIAWPTLGLFALALMLWGWAFQVAVTGALHPVLAIVLLTVAAFMHFTVLHDGVHRSLMRGFPVANEVVATTAGAFLGPIVTGAAFRYVHFTHHRHTNDPQADPDGWSGVGPRWRLPLQWATADLMYARIILRDWSQIPRRERAQIIGVTGGLVLAYTLSWPLGWGAELTLFWLLPSRIAILWLAFAFNFLPHHPHDVPQSQNPYAATNVRRGGEPLMKWLFLYQNYHLIHHLFPSVPFYRYLKIWNARREDFTARGTVEVSLWSLD